MTMDEETETNLRRDLARMSETVRELRSHLDDAVRSVEWWKCESKRNHELTRMRDAEVDRLRTLLHDSARLHASLLLEVTK
jgi:predicted RNase H-like nuclease (RuvC/YqgF family)